MSASLETCSSIPRYVFPNIQAKPTLKLTILLHEYKDTKLKTVNVESVEEEFNTIDINKLNALR